MSQEWNPEQVLKKWVERNSIFSTSGNVPCLGSVPIQFYKEGDYIPISELESAVQKSARIVNQLGPDYLGIFERAEHELEKAKQNLNTLERIQRIALSGTWCVSNLEGDLVKPKSFLFQAWSIAVPGTDVFMSH